MGAGAGVGLGAGTGTGAGAGVGAGAGAGVGAAWAQPARDIMITSPKATIDFLALKIPISVPPSLLL
ncbi:MAG: hypothetical protein HW402_818 [Dehalococcoidales bacterium]|nr:hypothetical protein [Dehalococcoidales bacterium]